MTRTLKIVGWGRYIWEGGFLVISDIIAGEVTRAPAHLVLLWPLSQLPSLLFPSFTQHSSLCHTAVSVDDIQRSLQLHGLYPPRTGLRTHKGLSRGKVIPGLGECAGNGQSLKGIITVSPKYVLLSQCQ